MESNFFSLSRYFLSFTNVVNCKQNKKKTYPALTPVPSSFQLMLQLHYQVCCKQISETKQNEIVLWIKYEKLHLNSILKMIYF